MTVILIKNGENHVIFRFISLDSIQTKGSIVVECGRLLQKKGYRIKILNTINFGKSMHYNPFSYIHSEKDILKLVTTLIANTKGEGKAGEDFWVSATRSHTNAAPCAISSTD